MGLGYLKIILYLGNHAVPVRNATVLVKDTNGNILHELKTDENGITEKLALEAPDKKYSTEPNDNNMPVFTIVDVEVPPTNSYKRSIIHNVEVFDTITSNLSIQLHPVIKGEPPVRNIDEITIPLEHGVDLPSGSQKDREYYDINDINIAQLPEANEVRVPYYISVHLGSPNVSARNVTVPFVDYIKNVASSEIFPTWEESAIYANVYAQISFALNRIYTVWWRSRGYDFDITNSTAFDQYFVEGRCVFENISRIVDDIFNRFIRRGGRREPFFASYCNGTTSTCAGLSQWGSQYLAQNGYTPIQILRYYYPSDVQLVESTNFTSEAGTFRGTPLSEGSSGAQVETMQLYLNRISSNFNIPSISNPNGYFGAETKASTRAFQEINSLGPDGIIGRSTWYAITRIYVAVTELGELTSEGERIGIGAAPPTTTIQIGARGELVVELQFILNYLSQFFTAIPRVTQTGLFGDDTKRSVVEFQKAFGLTPDGIVGTVTWRKLYDVYNSITEEAAPEVPAPNVPDFPGTLTVGSRGDGVLLMQNYLNAIAEEYPAIPAIVADGIFGQNTRTAVIAFQTQFGLTPDGIIGSITWNEIISVYNSLPVTGLPQYPGTPLRVGSRGESVTFMQGCLNAISKILPTIPTLRADGIFGTGTQSAVIAFQKLFGLTADGVIGPATWEKIVSVYNDLPDIAAPAFPGTALRVGSSGNDVILIQKYLNVVGQQYPSIPPLSADGIFGRATESAVKTFQNLFGLTSDGVVGRNTWNMLISVYNRIISGL